jgi:RNA polymerase sigma factor (sigma-70 family)
MPLPKLSPAAQQLVTDNLRLAYNQAHYFDRYGQLELDDLIGEAQLALVYAAYYFQPNLGFSFSTFATRCIVRRLVDAIETQKKSRLPQDTAAWSSEHESLVDSLPDSSAPAVLCDAEQEMLAALPLGVRFAFEMSLGLWDGNCYTPGEIAFYLGLNLEQVHDLLDEGSVRIRRAVQAEARKAS